MYQCIFKKDRMSKQSMKTLDEYARFMEFFDKCENITHIPKIRILNSCEIFLKPRTDERYFPEVICGEYSCTIPFGEVDFLLTNDKNKCTFVYDWSGIINFIIADNFNIKDINDKYFDIKKQIYLGTKKYDKFINKLNEFKEKLLYVTESNKYYTKNNEMIQSMFYVKNFKNVIIKNCNENIELNELKIIDKHDRKIGTYLSRNKNIKKYNDNLIMFEDECDLIILRHDNVDMIQSLLLDLTI